MGRVTSLRTFVPGRWLKRCPFLKNYCSKIHSSIILFANRSLQDVRNTFPLISRLFSFSRNMNRMTWKWRWSMAQSLLMNYLKKWNNSLLGKTEHWGYVRLLAFFEIPVDLGVFYLKSIHTFGCLDTFTTTVCKRSLQS